MRNDHTPESQPLLLVAVRGGGGDFGYGRESSWVAGEKG